MWQEHSCRMKRFICFLQKTAEKELLWDPPICHTTHSEGGREKISVMSTVIMPMTVSYTHLDVYKRQVKGGIKRDMEDLKEFFSRFDGLDTSPLTV